MWSEIAALITLTSRGLISKSISVRACQQFRSALHFERLALGFRYFGSMRFFFFFPHSAPLPSNALTKGLILACTVTKVMWHQVASSLSLSATTEVEFSQVEGGGEANARAFKCALYKWTLANLNTSDNLKQTKCRHRDSTGPGVCNWSDKESFVAWEAVNHVH